MELRDEEEARRPGQGGGAERLCFDCEWYGMSPGRGGRCCEQRVSVIRAGFWQGPLLLCREQMGRRGRRAGNQGQAPSAVRWGRVGDGPLEQVKRSDS